MNTKEITIVSLMSFILMGCAPSEMDKAKQDFACKDDGGVYEYTGNQIKDAVVECRNGQEIQWHRMIITEEFYPLEDKP